MNRIILIVFIIILLMTQQGFSTERPSLIITKQEAAEIKSVMGKYPLLGRSVEIMKNTVALALSSPI